MPVCARLVLGDSISWQSSGSWHMLANLCRDFVWQFLAQLYSISTLAATFSLLKQHYSSPEHKPWICFLLFSHVDKQGCSWSYLMQHILSVLSGDTKCSHAKQPQHSQDVGRYFIFISFPKKVQALLYAYREGQNKTFRFYRVHTYRYLQE